MHIFKKSTFKGHRKSTWCTSSHTVVLKIKRSKAFTYIYLGNFSDCVQRMPNKYKSLKTRPRDKTKPLACALRPTRYICEKSHSCAQLLYSQKSIKHTQWVFIKCCCFPHNGKTRRNKMPVLRGKGDGSGYIGIKLHHIVQLCRVFWQRWYGWKEGNAWAWAATLTATLIHRGSLHSAEPMSLGLCLYCCSWAVTHTTWYHSTFKSLF